LLERFARLEPSRAGLSFVGILVVRISQQVKGRPLLVVGRADGLRPSTPDPLTGPGSGDRRPAS
jgi:hypothetical protein